MKYLIALTLMLAPCFSAGAITDDETEKFNASQELWAEVCEEMEFTSDVYFAEQRRANLSTGYVQAIRAYKPFIKGLEACAEAQEAHTTRMGKLLGIKHKAYKILKRRNELDRTILNLRLKAARERRRVNAYMSTLVPDNELRLQDSEYEELRRLRKPMIAAMEEVMTEVESQKNEKRKLEYEGKKVF